MNNQVSSRERPIISPTEAVMRLRSLLLFISLVSALFLFFTGRHTESYFSLAFSAVLALLQIASRIALNTRNQA